MENSKKVRKKPSKAKTDIKAQINNEIIHVQEKLKQAKVSTIRNLVKKLKHPEKNPKQNLAAKAERYQNVLNQIKHMSPKRLGLLALLHYKTGKNYLADSQSTVEQLAVGYFSQYKGLNSILDAIKSKLNLDNAPDWRRLARKLFKNKDKTLKKEKMDEKKSAFAESDSATPNDDVNAKATNAKSNIKPEKLAKSANKKQKKQTESMPQNVSTSESDDAESSPPPTTVDNFFITADGSNYVSTAVASQKKEDDSDDDSKSQAKHGKGSVKKSNESSFFQKNNKQPVKLATNRFESGTKRKWTDGKEEQATTGTHKTVDPNLHPSWQAKQKLKPTIAEFKGKKITFD